MKIALGAVSPWNLFNRITRFHEDRPKIINRYFVEKRKYSELGTLRMALYG